MPIKINGEIVEDDVVKAEAERLRPTYYQYMQNLEDPGDPNFLEQQLFEWAKENVVEQVLLRQVALKKVEAVPAEELEGVYAKFVEHQGGEEAFLKAIDNDTETIRQIKDDLGTQLKVDRLVDGLTKEIEEPDEREMKAFYREYQERFTTPVQVWAKHIVLHADSPLSEEERKAEMKKAEMELTKGAPFEAVADQYSDCKGNGGDLGYFQTGQMVPRFEEVVFGLEPGDTSEIFETEFGLHIAKVYDRKPEAVIPYEQVKERIREIIVKEEKDRAIEVFIDKQRAESEVEFDLPGEGAKEESDA